MTKTLYLMRHGQTVFNLKGKIQGASDSPLTSLGIQQAQAARKYFETHNITFDTLVSSSQERASDTLENVAPERNYQRLKGIKEWSFGLFEGESVSLLNATYDPKFCMVTKLFRLRESLERKLKRVSIILLKKSCKTRMVTQF